METVCVMGLGYIGLPTASLLATKGYPVLGVDISPRVVDTINRGDIHIEEPDLDLLVRAAVHGANLRAGLAPEPASVFILAVPTPLTGDNQPDLGAVFAATRAIAPVVSRGNLVVLESTSPVGTTEQVAAILAEARPDLVGPQGLELDVAHCPERVLPGRILYELVENDRVVGGVTPASTTRAAAFYRTFVRGTVVETTARTAELTKLTENSFRDVNIAFANELSLVCDDLGVDVWELIELANRHPRVNILRPGPGVGGHCIAVDPWFVVAAAPERTRLIRTGREVNKAKQHWVVERVLARASRFRGPVVVALGITYKPDIDDLRESPALEICHALHARLEGTLRVVDPHAHGYADLPMAGLEALEGADIVVALVSHREFRGIGKDRLAEKVLIDTCGVFR